MKDKLNSLQSTAKLAGLLYIILISASLFSHVYVPSRLLVRDNAAATANNIMKNEFLFRTCVVVNLIEVIVFLFIALILYRLLKETSHHLARLMVVLACMQVPVTFVLAAFKLTSLMLLKNEPGQLPDLSMLFLQINGYGMVTLELLAGLWLFPFGMLVYQSRFIPRVLGVLLMVAGSGYVYDFLFSMLFPDYHFQTPVLAFISFGLGEVPIMLWLLLKGVKNHLSIKVIAENKIRPLPVVQKEFFE